MTIELRIPSAGESITEVTIGEWLKSEGNAVKRDEVLVTIETDKASMELPAPEGGILEKILKGAGESAQVGEVIGLLDVSGEGESATAESTAVKGSGKKSPERSAEDERETKKQRAEKHVGMRTAEELEARRVAGPSADALVLPAARRLLKKHGLSPGDVEATGPGGRLLKEDVLREVSERRDTQPSRAEPTKSAAGEARSRDHREEAVPMSSLRKAIAGRLVRATQEAALLTTFNEVDMSAVVHFRKTHGEEFLRRHEVKLGFMSFFIKATIEALKAIPGLNARIRDEEIIYRNYYDIGVAVGGGRGLVVPVLRNAERMSFAVIEAAIADLARRARDNSLRPDDLQGGTFTISNGGVYGSLLSTPIVNPPQSGVLGMHKIEDRPVAVAGKVVIRPMMYIALTYDHRIVDGREAVTFLRTIKEKVEDPTRILLEI